MSGTAPELAAPLDGVRVLALEQMQALPNATQLLARLGAEVIKVESPDRGDSGRSAQPAAMVNPGEIAVGATFLRNNSGKKSIAIDFRTQQGRDLVLELSQHVDVVCENLGPGRAEKLGLGYAAVSTANPRIVYLSISGFGTKGDSPYAAWPAYASVAEAMSGIYEHSRRAHQPPVVNPVGGLGDTGTGLFGVIGVLAALRHRDRSGVGQFVDVSMFDALLSICDVVTNYWSMGVRREPDSELRNPAILDSFRAADGWLMLQVSRRHQFERFADLLGRPEWKDDDRLATAWGWADHFEDIIRPAVEAWTSGRTKLEAARTLAESGIAAAPCNSADDVVDDPHVRAHRMLVEIPRYDEVDQPVLVAGNPVKMSLLPDEPAGRLPRLGEHTGQILGDLLGLDRGALDELGRQGIVGGDLARGGDGPAEDTNGRHAGVNGSAPDAPPPAVTWPAPAGEPSGA
jgi:crotonobetainyl-CoA:carnitine CoA-transferase CaiB-like acyl-CoA transferase